jgi:transcriptional regulator with XRE-family HTH domain
MKKMNSLPKNLRYLRKKIGKSQAEISKLVEKKQNTIGNWENEVSEPTIGEIARLAQFFGVTIQDLIMKDLEVGPSPEPIKKEESGPAKPIYPTYPVSDGFSSTAQEASQHQFWVIIGELRRVHEKLDSIKNQLDGRVPDKSGPARSGL